MVFKTMSVLSIFTDKTDNIKKLLEGFNKNYDEYTSNLEKYKDKTKLDYLLDNNEENFFKVFENIGFNSRDEYNKLNDEEKNRLNTYDLQFIYNFSYIFKETKHLEKQKNRNDETKAIWLKTVLLGNERNSKLLQESWRKSFLKQFLSKRENLQEVEKELGRDVLEICLKKFDFNVSYDEQGIKKAEPSKDLTNEEKLEKANNILEEFEKIQESIRIQQHEEERLRKLAKEQEKKERKLKAIQSVRIKKDTEMTTKINDIRSLNLTLELIKKTSGLNDKRREVFKIYNQKIEEEKERIAKQQDPNKYQDLSDDEMENIVLKELEEDKELQKLNLEFENLLKEAKKMVKNEPKNEGQNELNRINDEVNKQEENQNDLNNGEFQDFLDDVTKKIKNIDKEFMEEFNKAKKEGDEESRKTPEEDKNKGDKDKPFYKNPLVHFILLIILGALLWFIFKKKEIKEQEHNLKEIENKNKEEEIILDH